MAKARKTSATSTPTVEPAPTVSKGGRQRVYTAKQKAKGNNPNTVSYLTYIL